MTATRRPRAPLISSHRCDQRMRLARLGRFSALSIGLALSLNCEADSGIEPGSREEGDACHISDDCASAYLCIRRICTDPDADGGEGPNTANPNVGAETEQNEDDEGDDDSVSACQAFVDRTSCGDVDFSELVDCNTLDMLACDLHDYFDCLDEELTCEDGTLDIRGWAKCDDSLAECDADTNDDSETSGGTPGIPPEFMGKTNDNPTTPGEDLDSAIAAGTELFSANACAGCHGSAAEGVKGVGPRLARPDDPIADDLFLYRVMKGVEGTAMVGYESSLDESEAWDILSLIRSLESRAGSQ